MVGLLDPRQGDGTYVENRPSRGQLLWGILEPYVMGPVNAWQGLRDADLNTLLYDTGPRAQQAVENSFNVAGTVAGGSSVVPKPDDALNMGIKAFHGSPHDFDRFSLDKIGTGEGAQAYGHGLYFAEREGIARSYRDALAAGVKPELRPTDKYSTVGWKAEAEKLFPNDRERQAAFHLFNQMKNKDYVLENHDFITSLPHNQGKPYEWEGVEFTRDRLAQLADEFYDPGKMYEVEINADPDAFLDWDKPLSEQPEAIKNAIGLGSGKVEIGRGSSPMYWHFTDGTNTVYAQRAERGNKVFLEGTGPFAEHSKLGRWVNDDEAQEIASKWLSGNLLGHKGENFYSSLGDKTTATKKLSEAGIPGIKYLDAGSRSAGEGTRNYVVFDDRLISIIRKYGIAGLLGGGAALNAMTAEPQEQY